MEASTLQRPDRGLQMARRNGVALSCAAMMALGALAGGCGGSKDKDATAASKPADSSAAAAQQDAESKSDARNVATVLESCFVDAGSYQDCRLASDGTVGGVESGLSPASVAQITTSVTATGYTITSKSKSGASFVIAKDDSGALKRTCTPAGKGGCEAGGTW